jgi:hypothetical protein
MSQVNLSINNNVVSIEQGVTSVIEVITQGPQGPQGPQGLPGDSVSTGSFVSTSSFNEFTSSYNTGSFTGSFTGDGSGLFDIPASGITGLNLSQIASGSVSASISPETGLQVNTNVTATSFTGSLFGTSSYATQALSSSYSSTSSYAPAYLPLTGGTLTGDLTASLVSASVYYGDGSNLTGIITSSFTKTSDLINDGDDGVSPFISLEDLPSNLVFYPTSATSDILGYNKIVTSITDPSYDSVAVDINTGEITGSDQLIASLATSVNIIVGNPGLLNITTIGNIKRISGSGTAEFYFEVYKRDSLGVETLITTSSNTSSIVSAIYSQFSATALWNDGVFLDTDRIVLKFYGTKVGGGSNPTYNFQFGGGNPVRTLVPIPLNVIPDLNVAFTDIVDLGGVTGAVSIDWSLGVKHKLNLTGSVTITQTNYAGYEGQKVQEIQITSSDPSYTITWVDVDPLDFTDAIDFTTSTTYNNISVRLLRSNIFQSNNFVR